MVLEAPGEDIQCSFRSAGIVDLTLTWIRLVPRFGWRWNRWDGKSLYFFKNASVSERGVTLRASPDDHGPKLWGPYIYLPSGFYELIASVSVGSAENQPIASWQVFSAGRELEALSPIKLDASRYSTPQTVIRQFYMEAGLREVEFRIFVEQGQITIHWLRLVPPEGHSWERYYERGGRDSMLGLPLSAEGRAQPSVIETKGRYRRFERGTIYFNNYTFQAWEVWGTVGAVYEKLGGTGSIGVGFPIGPVQPAQSSYGTIGEYQCFRGWGEPAIFAYPNDRAHVCAIYGGISSKYWETGGPTGPLGFPTSENEYEWSKEGTRFRRSDFEGGYITWRVVEGTTGHPYPKPLEGAIVHLKPKPRIIVMCPKRIPLGEELVITITGKLEAGPINGAWCIVSFPDPFDPGSIRVRGEAQIAWPGEKSGGNYAKRSDYVLRYPKVEMGKWQEHWPNAPANSFEVRLRPAQPGPFRIFARFTAQDDFDHEVWSYDPPPVPGFILDQQDEAVKVFEVQVFDPHSLAPPEHGSASSSRKPSQNFQKDFFVSYNSADHIWAEWIAWELEKAGYTTVLQAWDFLPGSNFILEMEKASAETERTIAILSPDYLKALYTQPEWAAAFKRDPMGEQGLLVPVHVRECRDELKGLLAPIIRIDLVGAKDETIARQMLLDGVKRQRKKPPIPPSFPDREKPRFPG